MIYLASPYTSKEPFIQAMRVKACVALVGVYAQQGVFLFTPIVQGHEAEKVLGVIGHSTWMAHSFDALATCRAMLLAELPGWDTSKGVRAEIDYCNANKFPVANLPFDKLSLMIPKHISKFLSEGGYR